MSQLLLATGDWKAACDPLFPVKEGEREMDWRRAWRSLVLLAACVGFGFQVIYVSLQYFGYKTTIRVQKERPTHIPPIGACACLPY